MARDSVPDSDPHHGGSASIAVIGRCASTGCERPARLHVEVEVRGRVIRGPVCERCERATRLGAALLAADSRRLA